MTTEALADLLETLVNTPSETGQESALAEWTTRRLARLARGEVLRSGHSVVWRGPVDSRPLLVLAGHLDTVPANGNAGARRENGNVYGVGSTDMKGGDAVMLAVIENADLAASPWNLAAVFYDAEEGPHERNGLKRLLVEMPWLREARLAILLEPTDLRVELGCNGSMNAEVRVTGKSAHSARPWTGVNAIERAAPWLAEIVRFPVTRAILHGVEFRETPLVCGDACNKGRKLPPLLGKSRLNLLSYRLEPLLSVLLFFSI
jgi:succinyl-diaminopimelate desuccinylase